MVIVALAPVTLGAYDIGEREVWLVSSLVALVGFASVFAANRLTPEMQDWFAGRAEWRAAASRSQFALEAAVNTFFVVGILGALVLVVLGLLPDREPALYLTAVVLGLFWAAIALMFLVYEHRGMAAASDETEQRAE